jgi:hypothetical protein
MSTRPQRRKSASGDQRLFPAILAMSALRHKSRHCDALRRTSRSGKIRSSARQFGIHLSTGGKHSIRRLYSGKSRPTLRAAEAAMRSTLNRPRRRCAPTGEGVRGLISLIFLGERRFRSGERPFCFENELQIGRDNLKEHYCE